MAVLLTPLLTGADPGPLSRADTARLLDAHVCPSTPHDAIGDARFVDALRVHLWSFVDDAEREDRALAYIFAHDAPGFAPMLLDGLQHRSDNAQGHVLSDISRLTDAPKPHTLVERAPSFREAPRRALLYRAPLNPGDRELGLAALRAARAKEKDKDALLTIHFVAAALGGVEEARVVAKTLKGIDVDRVGDVMEEVHAVKPAPELAPLFRSWLDDKRPVGVMGHRSTQVFRVCDHGVWAVRSLGLVIPGLPPRLDVYDDAQIARVRAALDGLDAR